MNTLYTRHNTLQTHQSGAVLIVVLLFLILITLAGVIAVRNSSTDLKLSTSDQINTVLLQSADNVNSNIEEIANGDILNDADEERRYNSLVLNATGLLGYFITDEDGYRKEDVLEFCYRPRSKFYNIDKTIIRSGTGTKQSPASGFCNPNKRDDYNSDRATTMTQVSVDHLGSEGYEDAEDFAQLVQGVDTASRTASKNMFEMTSTSVLPAYGNKSSSDIEGCFKEEDIQGCLIEKDVATKSIVERAEVYNATLTEYCKFYGDKLNPDASPFCQTS